MGYCARVSNPENQENPDVAKLLRFCAKNGHWSVFEMADMCIEIQTTRAISAQIIRHRSFHFQEFCITGDSLITTILPANGLPAYIPIKKLYERQSWKNYRGIQLRVYDEQKESFTTAGFREIFFTGAKAVYEITLADGKKIKCTKEHKFLTRDGFQPLEDVIGLEMVGDRATMTKTGFVGTNGIPCHQDYEWLANARRLTPPRSLGQIARAADTSTHTIRKWLRIHQLQYSPMEVAQGHDKKHSIHGDPKIWAKRGRGNTLRARWTQVMKVEYLGIQDTYDIEVDHGSHNYVANKIVVHNSQRYAPVQKIEEVNPRSQDLKNRQSSHDDLSPETKDWFAKARDEHFAEAKRLYDEALAKGIAKESARFLLPMASGTTIYMKGTVRDWVHYINLRADPGTQLEHREIALAAKTIFVEQLPVVAEALGWERSTVYNGH